eukprot:GHUV01010370.1.p1 GENE.GHUV01010370.1~~GHUV01010370.1.p1  ORF type:complete len:210 (+),score=57.90 GHUV01010370.1:246-875(+)
MLPVFALGALGGVLCGAGSCRLFPGSRPPQPAEGAALADADNISTAVKPEHRRRKCRSAVASAICAGAAIIAGLLLWEQRQHKQGKSSKASRRDLDGRIPLQDLIRFKERQWFVEELENARDADPNAMLRLAKMYLHGQGCQRNIALAQEWVRKARNMGVPANLDELYATDDPDPRGKLRALAAAEDKRRALRRMTPAYMQQQRQAAAA